jgi:mono/diheme cytochrome c family protein
MTRARFLVVLLALLVIAVAGTHAAGTQVKREAARPIESIEGVDSYNAYCAVCHGKDGKGQGPAAVALKAPVPDLTTMAKRHGGKFSRADVDASIRGTGKATPAHGSADMPIWGPIFRVLSADDSGRTLRITNLVDYIESIQQK